MSTITLANLEQFSGREVFEYIKKHLLTQGRKATDPTGRCVYRVQAKDGETLKCAAGCIISDDEYNPSMEKSSWRSLVSCKGFSPVPIPSAHSVIINGLQVIHDQTDPQFWGNALDRFEEHYLDNDWCQEDPESIGQMIEGD